MTQSPLLDNAGNSEKPRVAFVSTRIAGTDGVSLEIEKWAEVLERTGVECYYIAGELDRPVERSVLIEEAHFNHPDIRRITQRAFDKEIRTPELTDEIVSLSRSIRDQLEAAIQRLKLDAIIAENAMTIPMNLPLGLALVQAVQEVQIGCVAHHHDFYWERDRFVVNAVDDLLQYAFPPALPQIQHVVINSRQSEEFSRRTGLSCRIIPNVMDFAKPADPPDDYARKFRQAIGLKDGDLLVLQPTRVVARKNIEHAIELVRRLERPGAKLVISHASGDEGTDYAKRIKDYAQLMGVELVFADQQIAERRGTLADGQLVFTLADAFSQADIVTYPSAKEGFGNAFLEAIYYRKPVVCNRYRIYRTDIEPCGFDAITFDGYLTDATVKAVNDLLDDPVRQQKMVEHNYKVAQEFFSYEVLDAELRLLVNRPHNIYRLLQRGRDQRQLRFGRIQGMPGGQ